jgi:hypothetical protein
MPWSLRDYQRVVGGIDVTLALKGSVVDAAHPHTGVHPSWCSAWSSKPVGSFLEKGSVGSIPMHSRHFVCV